MTTRHALPLLLVVSGCLGALAGCAGSDETASPAAAPPRAAAGGRRGDAPAAPGDLDLAAMVAPVPEYEGSGRNLFIYGPEPRVAPPPRVQAAPSPRPTAPARPQPTPRPAAATPRLNLKYAGFVEKTQPDGGKAKYAIFLDGNEILAGTEGETVANRFKVVEIGLESVTVAAAGSETTERIPLQSN